MSDAVRGMHDGALKLARGHRVQHEPAQGCHVLLYPEGVVQLNETAAMILQQIDGHRNAAGVVGELARQFPGEDLAGDVLEFLETAYGRGWLA